MKTINDFLSFHHSLSHKKRIIFWAAAAVIALSLLRGGFWLASRFNAPSAGKYLKQLNNPQKAARIEAIYAVGLYKTVQAVPKLEKMVAEDPDDQVRRMAAAGLGRIEKERLVQLLENSDPAVKFIAMDALMQLDSENLALLMDRFPEEDKESKLKILAYVEKQTDAGYAEELLSAAEKTCEDKAVRIKCLELLQTLGSAEMASRLLNIYYNDTDEDLRKAAQETVKYMKERK